ELGDVAETLALKGAFGADAARLAVSSTKSVTGHLLGAAGVVEAIFTTLALRDQVAPPTINLHSPGEGCDLDYVPNTARQMRIDAALSNSFGFGGTNGTLALRRFTGCVTQARRAIMGAPRLHIESVDIAPGALLALSAPDPHRYPVLLDSAAQGALSQVSLLAALPRGMLWLDARGSLHRQGDLPELPATGFLAALEAHWQAARAGAAGRPPEVPFSGGW